MFAILATAVVIVVLAAILFSVNRRRAERLREARYAARRAKIDADWQQVVERGNDRSV